MIMRYADDSSKEASAESMNAVNIEYRVLGYVSADSETFVKPFWIVLKTQGYIRSCILENWFAELGNIDWYGQEYIEDLLFEIRNQSAESKEGAEGLFVGIADLDSGPLRTVALGAVVNQGATMKAARQGSQFVMEWSRQDLDALLGALNVSVRCLEGVAYG